MATNLQSSSHCPRAAGFRLRNRKDFIYEVSKNLLNKLDSKVLEAFSEFIDEDLFSKDETKGMEMD